MSSARGFAAHEQEPSFAGSVHTANEQRINKIFERLTDIRSGVELQKDRRLEQTTQRIEELFGKLQDFEDSIGRNLMELKADIDDLEQLANSTTVRCGRERWQEVKKLQDRHSFLIESEMIERKESETAITRLLDDKCSGIVGQILQQSRKRDQAIGDLKGSLSQDLPRLSSEMGEQEKNREYCDTEIMEQIAQGLSLCTSEIETIREQREVSEQSTYEMLKQVLMRVGEQLLLERKKREATEQNILSLIQGMCDKVARSDR